MWWLQCACAPNVFLWGLVEAVRRRVGRFSGWSMGRGRGRTVAAGVFEPGSSRRANREYGKPESLPPTGSYKNDSRPKAPLSRHPLRGCAWGICSLWRAIAASACATAYTTALRGRLGWSSIQALRVWRPAPGPSVAPRAVGGIAFWSAVRGVIRAATRIRNASSRGARAGPGALLPCAAVRGRRVLAEPCLWSDLQVFVVVRARAPPSLQPLAVLLGPRRALLCASRASRGRQRVFLLGCIWAGF